MPRPTEGTAQRRKLLGTIERLAEIAVFGTLSETYRTCGREGCHCHEGHLPRRRFGAMLGRIVLLPVPTG